ncbi:hypothetical protein Cob_v003114 [Colletotrichum orbiculare MAFF 240422]|uniref:Uncharacterized protein n=1 Tax=Colletotrichum orbiculare (strain 104-T / ATCC 96160 / CBS 514.97 / LARS 414 / MAFF 240422) TaxID=1213857 RepID=A0A484G009_COLOR|nr:hypothetical protein Cob_v003114 [Colletotrichum orbiculare MAFF 240422]
MARLLPRLPQPSLLPPPPPYLQPPSTTEGGEKAGRQKSCPSPPISRFRPYPKSERHTEECRGCGDAGKTVYVVPGGVAYLSYFTCLTLNHLGLFGSQPSVALF